MSTLSTTESGLDGGAPPTDALVCLSVAELMQALGDIPPERVRLRPPPGTATEQDVIAADTGYCPHCELIDGTLVEKAVGFFEVRLAQVLCYFIEAFLSQHDFGFTVGGDAGTKFAPHTILKPDLSFVRWERIPDRQVPRAAFPELPPDLAVEVISPGNTRREMDGKLRKYFAAGVRLVWYVDPPTRRVTVYTSPSDSRVLDESQSLDGGDVLPGFSLSIGEWFNRAERGMRSI
jgi:Uma2 family endonuclease